MQKSKQLTELSVTEQLFRYNLDITIVCISLLALGAFLNGINALVHAFLCVITCIICEFLSAKFIIKKYSWGDLSCITTGLIIALMLPVNAPLYIGVIACIIAIFVAKLPFGGALHAPFVPACVGFCAISIFFPQYIFSYFEKSITTTWFAGVDESLGSGVALLDSLRLGDAITLNSFTVFDLLSGTFAGAIGTTSLLALFGAFLYLFIQNRKRLYPAVGFIVMCTIFAILFPRVDSILISIVMELCAGSLLFTALILISDPITSPKHAKHAMLYGAFTGAVYMLLRYYGKLEDPACFSVLIANAIYLVFSNKAAETESEMIEQEQETEQDEDFSIQQQDLKPKEKVDAKFYINSIIEKAGLDEESAKRLESYSKTFESSQDDAEEDAEATEVEATEVEATEVEVTEVEVTEVEATEVEATEAEATEAEVTEVEATEATEAEVTEVSDEKTFVDSENIDESKKSDILA